MPWGEILFIHNSNTTACVQVAVRRYIVVRGRVPALTRRRHTREGSPQIPLPRLC